MRIEEVLMIQKWWRLKGEELPDSILTNTGFTHWEDKEMLAGCLLYKMEMNGGLGGLIAHTITNPKRQLSAIRSVKSILNQAMEYSKENGIIILMGMTSSRLLELTYLESGFCPGDVTTQYIKHL